MALRVSYARLHPYLRSHTAAANAKVSYLRISTAVELASIPPPMDPWCHSDITFQRMKGLIRHSVLRAWTLVEEWLLPGNEDSSSPPDSYVVSFTHFDERGLATSTHKFLQGMLYF